MDEALKLHGIDLDFTIKERKKVFEGSMKKKDYTNVNRALDSFEEKLLVKKEERFSYTQIDDFSSIKQIISESKQEQKRLTASTDDNNIQSTDE